MNFPLINFLTKNKHDTRRKYELRILNMERL